MGQALQLGAITTAAIRFSFNYSPGWSFPNP